MAIGCPNCDSLNSNAQNGECDYVLFHIWMWQGQCDWGKSKWTTNLLENRIRHVYCRWAHSYGRKRRVTWLGMTVWFCRRQCAAICGGCVDVRVRALTVDSKAARVMACLSFLQLCVIDETTFCVHSLPATRHSHQWAISHLAKKKNTSSPMQNILKLLS